MKLYFSTFLILCYSLCFADKTPNIIIIFADDLGYGDLSCYGHPTIKTPNLDKLAFEGQKWTQFYSASHICSPSRAALLTGQYPVRTGTDSHVFFEWSARGLPSSTTTIAEVLRDNGYKTACIGKWHLGHQEGYLPTDHGFQEYFGVPYSNDMRVDPKMQISEKVLFREGMTLTKMRTWGNKVDNWVPLFEGKSIVEYPCDQKTLTKRYTEASIRFIEKNKDAPFFLYLSHNMPHIPLYASKEFEGTSKRGLYGDTIEEIDYSVGAILESLKENNIEDNTLIIFTSDNGPDLTYNQNGGSAGSLKGSKFYATEGGQRVPAIFWWPNKIEPGTVSELGSTLDLFKTCVRLAQINNPNSTAIDSFDLSRVLMQKTKSPRDNFFYFSSSTPPRGRIYAVRQGSWKAHFYTSGVPHYEPTSVTKNDPILLYNLDQDPSENYNLSEQNPEIVERLEKLSKHFEASIKLGPNQFLEKIKEQVRPEWAQ